MNTIKRLKTDKKKDTIANFDGTQTKFELKASVKKGFSGRTEQAMLYKF